MSSKIYKFDFGAYEGELFTEISLQYLKILNGHRSWLFDGRHPGLKEAFDYDQPPVAKWSLQDPRRADPASHEYHSDSIQRDPIQEALEELKEARKGPCLPEKDSTPVIELYTELPLETMSMKP